MALRAILAFGVGFLTGAYVDQNYNLPPVMELITKYKSELEKFMPEPKDDSSKKD